MFMDTQPNYSPVAVGRFPFWGRFTTLILKPISRLEYQGTPPPTSAGGRPGGLDSDPPLATITFKIWFETKSSCVYSYAAQQLVEHTPRITIRILYLRSLFLFTYNAPLCCASPLPRPDTATSSASVHQQPDSQPENQFHPKTHAKPDTYIQHYLFA